MPVECCSTLFEGVDGKRPDSCDVRSVAARTGTLAILLPWRDRETAKRPGSGMFRRFLPGDMPFVTDPTGSQQRPTAARPSLATRAREPPPSHSRAPLLPASGREPAGRCRIPVQKIGGKRFGGCPIHAPAVDCPTARASSTRGEGSRPALAAHRRRPEEVKHQCIDMERVPVELDVFRSFARRVEDELRARLPQAFRRTVDQRLPIHRRAKIEFCVCRAPSGIAAVPSLVVRTLSVN